MVESTLSEPREKLISGGIFLWEIIAKIQEYNARHSSNGFAAPTLKLPCSLSILPNHMRFINLKK